MSQSEKGDIARRRKDRTSLGRFTRTASRSPVAMTLSTRPSSPQEERLFIAALTLLVSEWVRHEFGRMKEKV